jgi:hypothetical protein
MRSGTLRLRSMGERLILRFRKQKKDPFGARRGPFFRERGMPSPLVEVIIPYEM